MADPSEKSLAVGMFLESLAGRTSAINDNKCVDPPFGCGGPATEFRDQLSAREYRISGLCQICQDKIFTSEIDDEEDEEEEFYKETYGDAHPWRNLWREW